MRVAWNATEITIEKMVFNHQCVAAKVYLVPTRQLTTLVQDTATQKLPLKRREHLGPSLLNVRMQMLIRRQQIGDEINSSELEHIHEPLCLRAYAISQDRRTWNSTKSDNTCHQTTNTIQQLSSNTDQSRCSAASFNNFA